MNEAISQLPEGVPVLKVFTKSDGGKRWLGEFGFDPQREMPRAQLLRLYKGDSPDLGVYPVQVLERLNIMFPPDERGVNEAVGQFANHVHYWPIFSMELDGETVRQRKPMSAEFLTEREVSQIRGLLLARVKSTMGAKR